MPFSDPEKRKEYHRKYNEKYMPEYNASRKDQIKEYDAARYAANVEAARALARARYAANKDKILAQKKARRDSKETNYNLLARVRNKRLKQQKPAWVAWDDIRDFYAACPPDKVVDHQVPIKAMRDGVWVACGFHAPVNFQYMDPVDNIRKSNKDWE